MSIKLEFKKKKSVVMIILAAGKSSRMNAIKQLLPWKNTTLLSNAIETGLKCKVNAVWVVLGANSEVIKPTINHFDVNILENKNWEDGLASSISYAIQQVRTQNKIYEGVLFCLADMPFISTTHLNKIIDKYDVNQKSLITTQYESKVMVPALFDASYFEELTRLTGDFGAKKLLKKHKTNLKTVELNNKTELIDLDNITDYDFYRNTLE